MKKGRLIVAFCIGIAWTVLIRYAMRKSPGLSSLVVTPHFIMVLLAVIFNGVGMFHGAGWPAIVAGVLYAVSIAFAFPVGGLLIIPLISMILCFTASKPYPPQQPQDTNRSGA